MIQANPEVVNYATRGRRPREACLSYEGIARIEKETRRLPICSLLKRAITAVNAPIILSDNEMKRTMGNVPKISLTLRKLNNSTSGFRTFVIEVRYEDDV